jgi:hypothetical protein
MQRNVVRRSHFFVS